MRSQQRDVQKKMKLEEKSDLAKTKLIAKAAADKVVSQLSSIFEKWEQIDFIDALKTFPAGERAGAITVMSTDEPWLLTNYGAVTAWKSESRVQVTLANFATTYKTVNIAKIEGKTQAPIINGEGKEETETMFKTLASTMAKGAVPAEMVHM